jgi:transcriptional antiterminator RfaH
MNLWGEMNWFAVQAKPHAEQLAATGIANLDLEVFLPLIRRSKSVCGQKRSVIQPLFQGYFFARFVPNVSLDPVRFCHGVLRVVGTSRFPIPLESGVVAEIRERVRPDGFILLETPRFGAGDAVRIKDGPFQGFVGRVEQETDDGRRVGILLEAIHNARLVIEKCWLVSAEAA